MNLSLLVVAKAPVPGGVKTRLCPPCTPEQAALVARAALEDTLSTVDRCPALRRVLVLSGEYPAPSGWEVQAQRGEGFGERLAAAFTDAALFHAHQPALLVGTDTPQLTPALVEALVRGLDRADAVLGPAADGGWWGLALRDPAHASVLRGVPMSTSESGRLTAAALRGLGLRVSDGPLLRDVDTAADARVVAAQCPAGSFAAAVRAHIPADPAAVRILAGLRLTEGTARFA
ncbi:MAG: TIGR04282 family arsenosugar biosynthesis glycosyltransferase [Actinomycetota bacterium]